MKGKAKHAKGKAKRARKKRKAKKHPPAASKPKKGRRKKKAAHTAKHTKPSGGRIMAKHKGKKSGKSGFPAWVRPTLSMIVGGGVGLVAMGILPDAVAPYAPALGVVAAKFVGGGGWGKYLVTAGVVGGVTFLSRRNTIQIAAGALTAAKRTLASGPSGPAAGAAAPGSAADRGSEILRRQGLTSVK